MIKGSEGEQGGQVGVSLGPRKDSSGAKNCATSKANWADAGRQLAGLSITRLPAASAVMAGGARYRVVHGAITPTAHGLALDECGVTGW